MAFKDVLYDLGEMVESQLSIGENKNHSLDSVDLDGKVVKYGKLGDFANKIDQSATRSYTEEGFFKHQNLKPQPKALEILMQEPDFSVLIKKRAFSSLAENYHPELMDDQERLLLKCTKILFQNKCEQISAYEKLTKIEKISKELGYIDSALLPIIIGATETFDYISSTFSSAFGITENVSKLRAVLEKLKKAQLLSERKIHTTWTPDVSRPGIKTFGDGTGVIEFTNVTSFNTNISVRGGGSCNINFSDPYQLMIVSNLDIEKAIADAANKSASYMDIGITSIQSAINTNLNTLSRKRLARGASKIEFKFQPDTFLGQRVRAIVENGGFEIKFDYSGLTGLIGLNFDFNVKDSTNNVVGFANSVNIDPTALYGSQFLGNDGLTTDEASLFNDIVSLYYKLFQLNQKTHNEIKSNNDLTNYVRKKLRLFYGNKPIIQPMDVVHIYINSKSSYDSNAVGILKNSLSQLDFMSSLNGNMVNIEDYLNINNSLTLEKSIFVGADFPNSLWRILRNQFVNNKNGTHVFAGVISEAQSSYSAANSTHIINVSAKDNLYYFEHGIVNFKPSVDVFNGPLYDPLTPFDIKFDSTTGIQKDGQPDLLPENKKLITSSPAFLKYKQGPKAGKTPTDTDFNHDHDRAPNGLMSRVYYDPDGFVYRWKEGIATYVLFGDNYNNPISPLTPVPISENIFAGQDAMNIISLLICGEPYNYTTFFQGALDFDSIGNDSASFFKKLGASLKKRNYLYGNFVPFKKLILDEQSFTKIINSQLSVLNFDSELQDLLKQRSELADKLMLISGRKDGPIEVEESRDIAHEILKLDTEITARQESIQKQISETKNNLKIIGNDITFDSDLFLSNDKFKNESLHNPNLRRELRRKVNYLTQRLYWKVKANEDTNLFIVDDTYDKDYDIQIFEKSIVGNFSIFQSHYSTPKEQIISIANTLNLEVFADTQGHIQVRIPQYNRIPSSIFYRMIKLKEEYGIEIFPNFLKDIFSNHLESMIKNIEIIEDEIRINCALLGKITDESAEEFISGDKSTFTGDVSFKFISNSDGSIFANNNALNDLKIFADPDLQDSSIKKSLDTIEKQNSTSSIFDVIKRSKENVESFKINSDTLELSIKKFTNLETLNAPGYINSIKNRIFRKTGQQIKVDDFNENISTLESYKISQEIAQKISQRQKLIKSASYAIKNIKEGISLSQNKDNSANSVLFPALYGTKNIPESFEHMIEDESYDDLGPGSGSRYIIKNSQILNLTVRESSPEFTAVNITGSFDPNMWNLSLPQDLNITQGGGNALTTVSAVDYDLWRMYGIKIPQNIQAPFITDPETQGAPYAVSYLNKTRGEIIKARVELIGNEYIQPGEVYYLEDRDLLFYSESVSHSYSASGKFSTTVEFTCGHNPGEYIPTPLDIIGKVFYKNKDTSKLINYRQDNVYDHDHAGIIIVDSGNFTSINGITDGKFANENIESIQKIIYNSAAILSRSNSEFKPKLELRIYFNSNKDNFSSVNSELKSAADSLAELLTGTAALGKLDQKNGISLNKEDVIVKEVDVAQADEFRFTSGKAFYAARNIANNTTNTTISVAGQSYIDKVDNIIYNFIIDCWITLPNE